MITRLVEVGERRKADQYWPDKSGKLEVGGGCWLEHLSTYYQGSYHLRCIEFSKTAHLDHSWLILRSTFYITCFQDMIIHCNGLQRFWGKPLKRNIG